MAVLAGKCEAGVIGALWKAVMVAYRPEPIKVRVHTTTRECSLQAQLEPSRTRDRDAGTTLLGAWVREMTGTARRDRWSDALTAELHPPARPPYNKRHASTFDYCAPATCPHEISGVVDHRAAQTIPEVV